MTRNLLASAFLIAAVTVVFVMPAQAKEKNLGKFGAWRAYAQGEGGQNVCYMVTTQTVKATALKRATPYLMITHRPVEASTDVFSYGAGTILNSKRGAKIRIGQSAFDLFSVGDIAWARDALTDHKIAAAIKNAPQGAMTAQASGLSTKKPARQITDVFDLTGAGDAYHAIGKACGLIHDKPKKSVKKHAAK